MTQYPVNRPCPITGRPATEVLGYISADVIGRGNITYRADFTGILQIQPDDAFPIVRGPSGFVYAGWLPPPEFLKTVYEDVIDHSKSVTSSLGYRKMQLEFAAGFFQFVEGQGKGATLLKLLDYGCGYGALLRMLASRDVRCLGFEPSAGRGERAALSGFEITADIDRVRETGPFDLLVLTEVLEHVPDPRTLLKFLKANASPGALLAITVPGCEDAYVENAMAGMAQLGLPPVFNPWEHLNYFSAANLRALLRDEGFEVVNDFGRARPMVYGCARFGTDNANRLVNGVRVMKAALRAQPTTELFCRSI